MGVNFMVMLIEAVVAMGRQLPHPKSLRIVQPPNIGFHNNSPRI
jgi:hypothetical protein